MFSYLEERTPAEVEAKNHTGAASSDLYFTGKIRSGDADGPG